MKFKFKLLAYRHFFIMRQNHSSFFLSSCRWFSWNMSSGAAVSLERVEGSLGDWSVSVVDKLAEGGGVDSILKEIRVVSLWDESKVFTFPISFVQGVAYPVSVAEARWNMLSNAVKLRSDDVFVVSYPKCGTTWTEQTVLLLQTRGDSSLLNPATKNVFIPGESHCGKIW
jgi:hypothetical protein